MKITKNKITKSWYAILAVSLTLIVSAINIEANQLTEAEISALEAKKLWCSPLDGVGIIPPDWCLPAPKNVGIGEASSHMRNTSVYRVPVKWDPVITTSNIPVEGYLIKVVGPGHMTRIFKVKRHITCFEIPKVTGRKWGTSISVATIGKRSISSFTPVDRFRTCVDCKGGVITPLPVLSP